MGAGGLSTGYVLGADCANSEVTLTYPEAKSGFAVVHLSKKQPDESLFRFDLLGSLFIRVLQRAPAVDL